MHMTEQGRIVYDRTYSRTKPDGSRETWSETVERVVDGNLALGDRRHELAGERDDLIRMMTEFKMIPAGRHLWASGVKGRQYLFNCWVAPWGDDVTEHFSFTFLRLMEGGGVGANYSNRYLAKYLNVGGHLPMSLVHQATWREGDPYLVHIVCDSDHPDYEKMRDAGVLSTEYVSDWDGCYEVADSREGWSDALVDLIETYYRPAKNANRVFDVSRVRGEGERLKTFGGRASGPLPLARMLHEVAAVLNGCIGRRLDGISAMEIDHAIAKCVVSGGNRRSARMSIMRWDDPQIDQFLTAKQETGKHWTTNISVEVDDEFFTRLTNPITRDYDVADGVLSRISTGMLTNGEPGVWNSSLSNVGEPNPVISTNPCLTGDTVIATLNGPRTFADLAESGDDVEVYSWDPKTKRPVVRWMRRPHKTRENASILKVTFDSGLVVRCTPNHSFYTFRGQKVQAQHLKVGKSIRAFSASRDSSGHERVHGWDSRRNGADHQWTHRMVWENEHGPVPDGMVIAHLDHDARNNDLSNLAAMTPYQHAAYDYPLRKEAGFDGHSPNHKVVSVEDAGFADVYNGMVEDSHTYIVLDPDPVAGHLSGIVSANCGEIALQESENCNLGHVNLAAFVDPDTGEVDEFDMLHAHDLVTRFLIRATNGDVNDARSRALLDRNRRIGVGHLGVASFLAMSGIPYSDAPESEWFIELLDRLSDWVDQSAAGYAHDLRIPVPVKTRTVAPTGTIAKLVGVSEGIHPIFSKYFIRRIRFSTVDPDQVATLEGYIRRGYGVEDDRYADMTRVVSLPTKDSLLEAAERLHGAEVAEQVVQSAADLTLREMLAFQEMYQDHWADNAVSYTVNFDPGAYTAEEVADALVEFGPVLKGATLFPEQSMPQSPYERISKADYALYEMWQVGDGVDENCASGACPVK